MSSQEKISQGALLARVGLVLLLLAGCAALGAFFGWLSAPKPQGARESDTGGVEPGSAAAAAQGPVRGPLSPLYFYAGMPTEGETDVITAAEIAMAAAAGVRQIIAPVSLSWSDQDPLHAEAVLARIAAASPASRVLLELRVDPHADWLARHPDERQTTDAGPQPFASVASALWAQEAGDRVAALLTALSGGPHRARLGGIVLAGLGKGHWISEGRDTSAAMREGFRAWLGKTYADDAGLAKAWGDSKATLATVEIPAVSNGDEGAGAFVTLPARQAEVDFRRYVGEATATLIAGLAARARDAWPEPLDSTEAPFAVFAAYGQNIENPGMDSGQFALGMLMDSAVDGFVSPFSYADRGLGGTGGPMATAHSARYHGKQWLFVDDTRTGIARDAITGAITRLEGLRDEDVHSVFARNFSLALINGMGMVWADPRGEGTLHDDRLWQRIGTMRGVYEAAHPIPDTPAMGPPTLVVVYDEAAALLTRHGSTLHERAQMATREAALRVGLPTHFALLSDFLADRSPPAPVYLFANTFQLSPPQRETLHARLAREQAHAIWFYAPGYFAEKSDTANIAATVGMGVKSVREGELGSEFLFTGRWVEEGRPLESPAPWSPLFHIDEAEADPLARYVGSERVSIAMRFMPEGWTSIYIAEPSINAPVLREILGIIEQPIPIRPGAQRHYDAIFTGNDLIAIHGRQTGERTIDLGGFYDVVDLLDPEVGWPARDNFVLSLKTGETRLLRRSLVEGMVAPPMPSLEEIDPEFLQEAAGVEDLAGAPETDSDTADASDDAVDIETAAP